jgi:hypothetical protein
MFTRMPTVSYRIQGGSFANLPQAQDGVVIGAA